MRWSRGWMGNTSSSTPASIRDRMSRSKNVATRAGYLLVKTASFTLKSLPLRPNVQQDPCGQAVEVNAMPVMRLRHLAQGRVGCHVAGALQLRGPPDTPFRPPGCRDRKSTRLNSSHTVIYTLSLHDALPICS